MSRIDHAARRQALRHANRTTRRAGRALCEELAGYPPVILLAYGCLPPVTTRPTSRPPAPRAELLSKAERDPAWDIFLSFATVSDLLAMVDESKEFCPCFRL